MDKYNELCVMLMFKQHADVCADAFDSLAQGAYLKEFSLYDELQKRLHPQLVSWVEQLTLNRQIASDDRVALSNLFSEISRYLRESETLICTFGYAPRAGFYKTFYPYVVNAVQSSRILLDIIVDPSIIGGAAFNYRGRYYNFSTSFEFKESFLHQ